MTDAAKYRSYSEIEVFLHSFYSLTQTARIHSGTHTLVLEGIEKFSESIRKCMEDDSLTFKISNDQLYINDEKLPYTRPTAFPVTCFPPLTLSARLPEIFKLP